MGSARGRKTLAEAGALGPRAGLLRLPGSRITFPGSRPAYCLASGLPRKNTEQHEAGSFPLRAADRCIADRIKHRAFLASAGRPFLGKGWKARNRRYFLIPGQGQRGQRRCLVGFLKAIYNRPACQRDFSGTAAYPGVCVQAAYREIKATVTRYRRPSRHV